MLDLTDEELDDLLWQMNEDSSKISEYIESETINPKEEKDG